MAIGDITAKDRLVRTDVGRIAHWSKANGNYWILAYNKPGSDDITVESYLLDPSTGLWDSDTPVDTQDFSDLYGAPLFAKQIAEGVVAIWGTNGPTTGGDGKIITIAVSSSGIINPAILGSLVWKVADDAAEAIDYEYDAVRHPLSALIWAWPFRWGRFNGSWTYTWRLAVVSISLDGTSLSVTDNDQISAYTGASRTNIKAVSGTIFAVCVDSSKVITVDINTSGIITNDGVDSTDFGFSRQWIEKLDNGWWVMAHDDSGGKLGSFKITDVGVIDNSFTDTTQFNPSPYFFGTCFNLGGGTTGYIITNYRSGDLDSHIVTCSCDIDGAMVRLQTLEWETVDLYSLSMVQVAYNMFLVEGDTSSGDDIYSETIKIVSPVTVSPSNDMVRVTALVIHWSAGPNAIYQEEILTGGLFSQYFSPISPIKEPEATLPELVQNRQPARDILSRMVPTLREYGEWLGTHSQEEQRAILRGIPGADILTLRVWQEWVVGRRSMGKDI